MTTPTSVKVDRCIGVLLGLACGDALGVPYEFKTTLSNSERAVMKGGGLGPYRPGEYSDDTQMAVCIAQVAAEGRDLTGETALDAIAERFIEWARGGASDIGIQTSSVIARASGLEGSPGRRMSAAAAEYYAENPSRAAGNGALMRTGIIGVSAIEDREATAQAARAIAQLTHADPLAGDSCVLWCEAIRIAVQYGEFEIEQGLDLIPSERRDKWAHWIRAASSTAPSSFVKNGFTAGALQAAWSAIRNTPVPDDAPSMGSFPCQHLALALDTAVHIGHDTDTVAAIAGSLLGARWGGSAVPAAWRRAINGWSGDATCPVYHARDLLNLAVHALRKGADDDRGWPGHAEVDYGLLPCRGIPHPSDSGVLLGNAAPQGREFDAVVSLCRIGHREPWAAHVKPEDHIEAWLMDKEDPARNPNRHFVIDDAARAVATLRAEGKRVWLHCVAAHNRTPTVAARYGVLSGNPPITAQEQASEALRLKWTHYRASQLSQAAIAPGIRSLACPRPTLMRDRPGRYHGSRHMNGAESG